MAVKHSGPDAPEPDGAAEDYQPDDLAVSETVHGKKQTWCAFITAGIYALDSVICNIEKDIREKLPLVETQDECDSIRELFQSYINKQTELIKRI